MKKSTSLAFILFFLCFNITNAQEFKNTQKLSGLQQQFVNLRFGMFIHFNIATYVDEDWPDPATPASIFNPTKLDCDQWAKAAISAHMSYGCLTTKHHSGFCIWNTKTTDYNVMNSPLKRDVVKEFVTAFRKNNLKVMLYFSILDTHHGLRPRLITKKHVEMIKAQLTELLTNYGPISALIFDGWDAPWSRISYDDVPFEEIYMLVKSLQPDCLMMDLNSAKYPGALFYTDIKSYEQNAGQNISKGANQLPALSCLPLQSSWFWKTSFPNDQLKDPNKLVNDNIIPLNNSFCNFILNVAPNRDGLIDDNALHALKQIGKIWENKGPVASLKPTILPIISSNIAKFQQAYSSWSSDSWIMDFANDDDFGTAWQSNKAIKNPWFEIDFKKDQPFNMITIVEPEANIRKYRLQYEENGKWKNILTGTDVQNIKIHRFNRVWGGKVRILIDEFSTPPAISEFGIYNERPE
jgi:alpha-L-fucosidase